MEKHLSNIHTLGARPLPANFGPLKGANGHARITGPCGDTMEMWLGIGDGRIVRATFTTDGCRSSLIAGCMAAWLAEGKRLDEAGQLLQADVLKATGDRREEHCALLALNTLHAAVEDYRHRQIPATGVEITHPVLAMDDPSGPNPPPNQTVAATRAAQSQTEQCPVL